MGGIRKTTFAMLVRAMTQRLNPGALARYRTIIRLVKIQLKPPDPKQENKANVNREVRF